MARIDASPTTEQLQDLLLESPGFTEFLLGLVTISASMLGGREPVLCAITVERDGGPSTVASSTDKARRLDEKQYAFDDGPCLTALRHQHRVLIDDLQGNGRWAGYARAVHGEGIRSVLAVPIQTDPSSRAALNCYAYAPGTFDDAMTVAVQEHAETISKTLRLALRLHVPEPYPEHLRSALQSRAVVDAAISLIMLHNRCGRDRAMELLQIAARDSNRRLHEIATDILHTSSPPGPTPPSGSSTSSRTPDE
ncbi:GAF and ANTAR domain-containing protein [Arthrobacter sp. NPDC080073]|uniref:GAF and ANTAR domain-containing protein n=1 Tax=Arthrobacter sp. NPDC080073 TaxID=3155919 RepID=UPI00344097CB